MIIYINMPFERKRGGGLLIKDNRLLLTQNIKHAKEF
jgi:hypothetical protein